MTATATMTETTDETKSDALRLAEALEQALPDDASAQKHAWRLRFVLEMQDGDGAEGERADARRELRLAIMETHVLRAADYIDATMQRVRAPQAQRPAGVAVDEAIAQLPEREQVAA